MPTSSLKQGGGGHLKLFDESLTRLKLIRKVIAPGYCQKTLLCFLFICNILAAEPSGIKPSKAAAERCSAKLNQLEASVAGNGSAKKQTIKFSQDEINSYFALDLSSKYHPCLRGLTLTFEEGKLKGVAVIDFDRLEAASTLGSKLLSMLFSGTHILSIRGKPESKDGMARFLLEEALFDDSALPKALVEKIISLVGGKQKPPFDPLKPSELPFGIQWVEVHAGYLVVHQ